MLISVSSRLLAFPQIHNICLIDTSMEHRYWAMDAWI